ICGWLRRSNLIKTFPRTRCLQAFELAAFALVPNPIVACTLEELTKDLSRCIVSNFVRTCYGFGKRVIDVLPDHRIHFVMGRALIGVGNFDSLAGKVDNS